MTTTSQRLSDCVRPQFPALRRTVGQPPVAYFDGPGGTQVPQAGANAVSKHLLFHNANDGWAFASSRETDATLAAARASVAAFVSASSPDEMLFGASMTTLTFHLARAVGRSLRPGDEIIVTDLDHHANVDPWFALARDDGAVIRQSQTWRPQQPRAGELSEPASVSTRRRMKLDVSCRQLPDCDRR